MTGLETRGFTCDTVVVGGRGHVGLPLAIALADPGARVTAYDLSETAVASVNAGRLPYGEPGAAGGAWHGRPRQPVADIRNVLGRGVLT